MPRLLLVCEYPTLHGGERSMLATLDGVRAAGFEVAVAAPPQGPLALALRAAGVAVLPFEAQGGPGPKPPQGRLRADLAAVVARFRPALLHANSLSMGRLSGPVAAELGVPGIAHLRDIIGLSRAAVADLNRHARLLAVSRATRDHHVAAGLDPRKTRVLHNGVDLARFCPRPATGYLHRELGLAPDALLAAAIGQIGLRKGQDVLARAAETLAGRLPALHYLIVGQRHSDKAESRQFEAALRAAAAGKGDESNLPRSGPEGASHKLDSSPFAAAGPLAGRLRLLGTRGDVDRLLNELTLLVHPARQEPLGRVLLEAAASGVPAVATDVGGTREIFPREDDGATLVPPDDPDALAAAIGRLVRDAALRRRLAAAARRRAEEAFNIAGATAGLVAHYRDVLTEA